MTQKTLILHDDPQIFDTVLDFVPEIPCFVGDFLEYEALLEARSVERYRELKSNNEVNVIVEREVILGKGEQTLVLYLSSKPAL